VGEVLVKAQVYHLQINVRDATRSLPFYKDHVAFRVERRDAVERFRDEFMAPRRLAPLYETPREFPEYRPGYYAVLFEDPDRLKLEVVHVPSGPGG
jgi:catechol 2,3-dioxygenase-like lactoylglutathione lyase family enzyme